MKLVTYVVMLAVLISPLLSTDACAEHSFEAGLGMPQGFMDVSANSFLNLTLLSNEHFQLQPVLHESFAAKKSEGDWLKLNALAGYGLLRYDFTKPAARLKPFVAAGGGMHMLMSFAAKNGPVHDDFELRFLVKAHGFVGAEYTVGENRHLSLKGRFTYPSDLVFDAVYLNYGFRF